MSWVRCRIPLRQISTEYRKISRVVVNPEEYTEVAQYPPIVPKLKIGEKKKEPEISLDLTVEERQIKQNINHYYGRRVISFNNTFMPYNGMGFVEHCTNTKFVPGELPSHYKSLDVGEVAEKIRPLVEDAILLEHDLLKSRGTFGHELSPEAKNDILLNSIIKHINRIILNNLPIDNLSDVQIDIEPRHNHFWIVDGIPPPENSRKYLRSHEWTKPIADNPIPRGAQYLGTPRLAVRSRCPLSSLPDHVPETDKPQIFDPNVYGFTTTHQHTMTVPGWWAGDKYRFGLVSYEKISVDRSNGDPDAPHAQAMLAAFAWTSSQAAYLQNPTAHPLLSQLVSTDGRNFNIYVFQLGRDRNVLWGGSSAPLFGEIRSRIIDFNPEVIVNILRLYANASNSLSSDSIEPAKTVSDLADAEQREWVYRQHRHLTSGRPRHRLPPEVYHWEKIYKIDHNSRPMEPRRRPFELGVNPWRRKLDDWSNEYIPKALREEKSKVKFRNKYYPK